MIDDGVVDAGTKGQQQRGGDWHIHAKAPALQVLPGATQERCTGIEQHRHRNQHAGHAQQSLEAGVDAGDGARVQANGVHRHLHGGESGESDALQGAATLQPPGAGRGIAHERHRSEAKRGYRIEYRFEREPRRVPGDADARGGQVDIHFVDAVEFTDAPTDGAGAVGTAHTLGKELGLRLIAALPLQVRGERLAHG